MNNTPRTLILLGMIMCTSSMGRVAIADPHAISLETSLYRPLIQCIQQGDLEGIRQYREAILLIGSLDWKDKDGHTLSWHAEQSKNTEIVKLLATWAADRENLNNRHDIDPMDVQF